MNIVHLLDYFHPNAGYQSNVLTKHLQKKGHNNTIITPEIDKYYQYLNTFFGKDNIDILDEVFTNKYKVRIARVKIRAYISSRAIYKKTLYKFIEDLKPDLLFVYDLDTYAGIKFILREKKLNYPVIFNSTMLEMASKNRFAKLFRFFYRKFITPKIVKRKLHIIKTQDNDYIHEAFNIPKHHSTYISFGSDTSIFYPDNRFKTDFRNKYQLNENEILFIYAGKLDKDKGSDLLVKTFAEKIISNNGLEAVLVLVGNFKEDDSQLERGFMSSESKILRFATVPYIELEKFYKSCDYSIFPKQVSLSFFDVQACGLPVILEKNDINIARTNFDNGYTFERNNAFDLRKKVIKVLDQYENNYKNLSENSYKMVRNNYSWDLITDKYLEVFKKTIEIHKRG